MGLTPQGRAPSVTKIPAGVHLATCYIIADIGHQPRMFEGHKKILPQVVLSFELHDPELVMEDGSPLVISKTYTNSLGDRANLRKDLESWRGKAFTEEEIGNWSLKNVLGVPCQLSIVHNAKGANLYANIASVIGVPKGTKTPKLHNTKVAYDFEENDTIAFGVLPEWIQKKINEAVEPEAKAPAAQATTEADTGGDLYDDLPF